MDWTEVQKKAAHVASHAWCNGSMNDVAEAVREFYAKRQLEDDERHVEVLATALGGCEECSTCLQEYRNLARVAIAWLRKHTLAPIAEPAPVIDEDSLVEEMAKISFRISFPSFDWDKSPLEQKNQIALAFATLSCLKQRGYLRTPEPQQEHQKPEVTTDDARRMFVARVLERVANGQMDADKAQWVINTYNREIGGAK